METSVSHIHEICIHTCRAIGSHQMRRLLAGRVDEIQTQAPLAHSATLPAVIAVRRAFVALEVPLSASQAAGANPPTLHDRTRRGSIHRRLWTWLIRPTQVPLPTTAGVRELLPLGGRKRESPVVIVVVAAVIGGVRARRPCRSIILRWRGCAKPTARREETRRVGVVCLQAGDGSRLRRDEPPLRLGRRCEKRKESKEGERRG